MQPIPFDLTGWDPPPASHASRAQPAPDAAQQACMQRSSPGELSCQTTHQEAAHSCLAAGQAEDCWPLDIPHEQPCASDQVSQPAGTVGAPQTAASLHRSSSGDCCAAACNTAHAAAALQQAAASLQAPCSPALRAAQSSAPTSSQAAAQDSQQQGQCSAPAAVRRSQHACSYSVWLGGLPTYQWGPTSLCSPQLPQLALTISV